MRNIIRPAAVKLGISRRIGWHTFRHTYSTLLRATGADIKVMQELLRHASARVTLDTYTQAITEQKRHAQSAVVKLLVAFGESTNGHPCKSKSSVKHEFSGRARESAHSI
jgi:integrase